MPALVTVLMMLSKSPESAAQASQKRSVHAAGIAMMHKRAAWLPENACIKQTSNTEAHQFSLSSLQTLID